MGNVVIRVAVDLKIFDILAESADPVTTRELAEKTGADYILLGAFILPMFIPGQIYHQTILTYVAAFKPA